VIAATAQFNCGRHASVAPTHKVADFYLRPDPLAGHSVLLGPNSVGRNRRRADRSRNVTYGAELPQAASSWPGWHGLWEHEGKGARRLLAALATMSSRKWRPPIATLPNSCDRCASRSDVALECRSPCHAWPASAPRARRTRLLGDRVADRAGLAGL